MLYKWVFLHSHFSLRLVNHKDKIPCLIIWLCYRRDATDNRRRKKEDYHLWKSFPPPLSFALFPGWSANFLCFDTLVFTFTSYWLMSPNDLKTFGGKGLILSKSIQVFLSFWHFIEAWLVTELNIWQVILHGWGCSEQYTIIVTICCSNPNGFFKKMSRKIIEINPAYTLGV